MNHYRPSGPVSVQDAIDDLDMNVDKPLAAPRQRWLVDLREADISINSHDDLSSFGLNIASSAKRCNLDSCRIGIISRDDLSYGPVNVIRVYAESEDSGVSMFCSNDESQTQQWLGALA